MVTTQGNHKGFPLAENLANIGAIPCACLGGIGISASEEFNPSTP